MVKRGPESYQEWKRVVIKKMNHLSKPQAAMLAMWSFGIVMTHCCGLSTIAAFMAELLEAQENTIRQRLKDWYRERENKKGRKRAEIDVKESFVPLLQWIMSWWGSEEKSLVLAADASTLGERFTLLVICVVIRGCGIPVAWKILPGKAKGSWKPHWLELLKNIRPGIPEDRLVIVTTDRGLYASWLYEAIAEAGWHPFMRINARGSFCHKSENYWKPLKGLITKEGEHWSGEVKCFPSNPLECTLLGRWDAGYRDPWLIVTDLKPEQADICWYSMRSWIECLFKDIKRGGFGWHQTKMSDPKRAERLWLAIAVATLWLVSVGGQRPPHSSGYQENATSTTSASPQTKRDTNSSEQPTPCTEASVSANVCAVTSDCLPFIEQNLVPTLSCFRRGFITILATLLKGHPLPLGQFIPDFAPAPG